MYALGAWYDPLVSAATGSVGTVAGQAATGATPALVSAIRQVLPDLKTTLSAGLSSGFDDITKSNRAVFVGFGTALALFTIGSLTLMYAQYRRLGKCCPVR